ncbi:hypothetical protein [Conexibacter sp. CPCC 206217]|uniref:hypothetical protein n=1 Tax=Conexibacter sp. CPCC 206217 TaxID=3064574 RepID=UPI0027268E98|nr:hypothetical protein [Conexibacter sp. CPCC 206217]MDO8213462.1 hypothetical protein [Conexibacter sp. CPCC 206217]
MGYSRALLAAIVVGLVALGSSTNALAISAPIHIHGTGIDGVLIRPTPDTSQPARGWMGEGTSPDFHCFTYGQTIGNVNVWFYVTSPAGITGYYASYWDDSSYHSEGELTAKYGIPNCGAAPPPPPPDPAPAPDPAPGGANLVFSVFNADGGIYYRRSPSWGDTAQAPGVGVYNGDQVQLICGAYGEAVGPYGNTWWSYVRNLTRPNIGEGWVNAHYINDGAVANQPTPGENTCDGNPVGGGIQQDSQGGGSSGGSGSTSGAAPRLIDGGSLYYSPYNGTKIDYNGGHLNKNVPFKATKVFNQRDWDTRGKCSPNPGNFSGVVGNTRITTVAAWSKPRNLPFALLKQRPAWIPQINYILLFDPGDVEDYADAKCPDSATASLQLAKWLAADRGHTFVVLAGETTAGYNHASIQHGLFDTVRHYPNPRDRNIRKQIIVCNYSKMNHEDVWINFHDKMNDPPIQSGKCPRGARSWNP